MTYEISLCQHEEEELKKKKEKGIALKVDIKGEIDKNNEDVESELSDFEMAFLVRKFRNFIKKKRYFPRKRNTKKKEISKEVGKEGEKRVSMCYECNKLGYFKSECPQISKEYRRKKKVFMAAWGDSKDSSSKDEQKEIANICFMDREDEVHSTSHSNS